MATYTFKCIRAGGPGPAIHCDDDAAATHRAIQLMDLWPLAVKVGIIKGERDFEVERGALDPTL